MGGRYERSFPIVEPLSAGVTGSGGGGGGGRGMGGGGGRRTLSRSPTRDEETLRERLRMMTRPMFRDFRPRFVGGGGGGGGGGGSGGGSEELFRHRQRFSGDYVVRCVFFFPFPLYAECGYVCGAEGRRF